MSSHRLKYSYKYSYLFLFHIKIKESKLHLTLKFLFSPSLINCQGPEVQKNKCGQFIFSLLAVPSLPLPPPVIHQLWLLTSQRLEREWGVGWKVCFQKGFSFPLVIQTGLWQMHGAIFCFSYVPKEKSLQLCRKESNYWLTVPALG